MFTFVCVSFSVSAIAVLTACAFIRAVVGA